MTPYPISYVAGLGLLAAMGLAAACCDSNANEPPCAHIRHYRCAREATGNPCADDCRPTVVEFVVYEPTCVPPGGMAPVVLYLHGAGGGTEAIPHEKFDPLLAHLAGQGYLVIFPYWNAGDDLLRPCTWFEKALGAYVTALKVLAREGRVIPDVSRTAIAGHSLGAAIGLRIAALSGVCPEIPPPLAVIFHDAAGYSYIPYLNSSLEQIRNGIYTTAPYDQFWTAPSDMLLVAILAQTTYVDEERQEARDGDAVFFGNSNAGGILSRAWWTTGIAPEQKFAFLVTSNPQGRPGLPSDHVGIEAPVNSIDLAYWGLTDAALHSAFTGRPFAPDVCGRWPGGHPRVMPILSFPPPLPFAWNCNLLLDSSRAFRWLTPPGTCQ